MLKRWVFLGFMLSSCVSWAADDCSPLFEEIPLQIQGQLSERGLARMELKEGQFLFENRKQAADMFRAYGRIFRDELNTPAAEYIAQRIENAPDELELTLTANPKGAELFRNLSLFSTEFDGFYALHIDHGVGDGASGLSKIFPVPRVMDYVDIRVPLKPIRGTDWVAVNLLQLFAPLFPNARPWIENWNESLGLGEEITLGPWPVAGQPGHFVSGKLFFGNVGRLSPGQVVRDPHGSLYLQAKEPGIDPELVIRLIPSTEDGEPGAWDDEFREFMMSVAHEWVRHVQAK